VSGRWGKEASITRRNKLNFTRLKCQLEWNVILGENDVVGGNGRTSPKTPWLRWTCRLVGKHFMYIYTTFKQLSVMWLFYNVACSA